MRVSLCALAILVASGPVSAQAGFPIQKGSVSLDGTANVSSSQFGDSDRTTTISAQPSALFFVADGLAVGATVSLARTSFGGDNTATSYGIGPTAAYFFGGPESTVYPFVSVGASFSRASFSGDGDDLSIFGGEVAGGAVFMLSRTVGLTGEAYYQAQSVSSDGFDDSFDGNEFGLRAGFVAFLY